MKSNEEEHDEQSDGTQSHSNDVVGSSRHEHTQQTGNGSKLTNVVNITDDKVTEAKQLLDQNPPSLNSLKV